MLSFVSILIQNLYRCLTWRSVNLLSINAAAVGLAKALNFHHNGTLLELAVKDGTFVNSVWHSYFLGSAPALQGINFPDSAEDYSPARSKMDLDLESPSFRIRDATFAGEPRIPCRTTLLKLCSKICHL